MSKPPKKLTDRKCLTNEAREVIAKVYDFLKADATKIIEIVSDPQFKTSPVIISNVTDHVNKTRKRMAMAAGVSERTITNIMAEKKAGTFKSPYKDRKKRANKEKKGRKKSKSADEVNPNQSTGEKTEVFQPPPTFTVTCIKEEVPIDFDEQCMNDFF